MSTTRARWIVPIAAGAVVALLAASGPARANEASLDSTIIGGDASYASCTTVGAPVFAELGDARLYVLAPGGTFEDGVGDWQLLGGASLVPDTGRGTSLSLRPGSSAISPAFCVDLNFPHLRLSHKAVGADAGDVELNVEVVYLNSPDPTWTEVKLFDGAQGDPVDDGWRVSPDIDLKPDLGGSQDGERMAALRFTARDKNVPEAEDGAPDWLANSPFEGALRIDDVFIDPRMRS